MVHLGVIKYLVIFHVLDNAGKINTELCSFRPHTDECENRGWLWDCSSLGLRTVPRNIPERYENTSLALDLSWNKFTTFSFKTFSIVNAKLLPNIKALYLQFNNVRIIEKFSFGLLENLCVLALYKCNLTKLSLANQSFANLTKLKVLKIHYNAFEHQGYPDIEISRILTLKSLTLGVFKEFHFSDHFRKLTKLERVILLEEKSKFHLTKNTFVGLSNSPIYDLKLYFRNQVYCDVSEEIFCSFPVLKGVYINFGGMCDLNVALQSLKCLQNRTMDYINADNNKQKHPEREVLLNKDNCKYLFNTCTKKVTLTHNRISRILYNPIKTRMGQCMEYFDISMNRIEFIKPGIMIDLLTGYPRLQALFLMSIDFCAIVRNTIEHSYPIRMHLKNRPILTINLSTHLTVLDASSTDIPPPGIPSVDFTLSGERLKKLYVPYTNFLCKRVAPIQTPSLEVLDISNNECSKIKYPLLQFATKLETFLASKADLDFTYNPIMEIIFMGLKRLKVADLSSNKISYLPPTTFVDQKLSLLTLYLDHNELTTIPVSHLQKLDHLYLRFNKLTFLTKFDIDNLLTLNKNITLHIEGNPINCECAHIFSLKWMKENKIRFGDLKSTMCVSQSVSLAEFFQEKAFIEFEKKCQENMWLTCSIIMLVLLLTTILTASLVKKYRVHVDYVILRMRSRWKGVVHVVYPKTFQFDAFMSYAEEDDQLACTTLYGELLSLGFLISFPDKDFIPGISKAEQLLHYIDVSRKVIFLVTENFLKSGWDTYAVQMVVTHAFHNHREKSMIVIIKDSIPVERMPKDLRYIWWSIKSIRWPENGENMMTFWQELSTALHSN